MYSRHFKQLEIHHADTIACVVVLLLICAARLAPLYPDKLMVGMEIRDKVATYVRERIGCLRRENPGQYQNISVMRHNAMKYLPNFFRKGQLTKLFFLFPVSGCCCSTTASAACSGALAVCVQCFGSCVGLFWMGIAVNCPARTYNLAVLAACTKVGS